MKKILLLSSLIIFFNYLLPAQSLSINTTGAPASTSAMLDVSSTTKGLLIPRMTDAQKTSIGSPATGLIIYQTDLITGLYQYDGAAWQHLLNSIEAWSVLGNNGIVSGTSFIGSINNADVAFRSNNTEAFRLTNAQKLLIGVTTATAPGTQKLEVSSGSGDAIYGHSTNIGGWVGYESNFSFGIPAQNLSGTGIYSTTAAAGYTAHFASTSGSATVPASINYSNVWHASYNLVDNASTTFNPNASYNQLTVSNSTLSGNQIALRGWNDRGTVAGNPGYSVGIQGVANAQNQDAIAVEGSSYSNSGFSTGGYFEGLTYPGVLIAYAYVGGWTNGVTARKIVGTGSVSEIVPTANHGRVTLTAPESPEYWYQDYGSVKLVNGKAHVELDPVLADIIFVNDENPIRVFCTPVDMPLFNGVCIINKTNHGFDIVEINNGTHSGTIDYQIVVKPKTNYGEGRFPQAPGPSYLKKDKEPTQAKAANNPADGRSIFRWPSDAEVYHYKPEEIAAIGEEIKAGPYKGMIKVADGVYEKAGKASKPAILVKEK